MRLAPFILLLALHCESAEWFASPSAQGTGDGSLGSPWHLAIALTNPASAIQPGDTLFLRGGTYHGPLRSSLSGTSGNYVTVRSHSNEWAIVSDPSTGTLGTNLSSANASTANVPIYGSEFWPEGITCVIGSEQLLLNVKHGTNWTVVSGWNGSTKADHSVDDPVIPVSDFVYHTGSYVAFRDFEITSLLSTNRATGISRFLGAGLSLTGGGVGNKAINLVIHNVGHPGIGFWNQGNSGEVNGCLIWGNGDYYDNGEIQQTRGSAVYSQNNAGGLATIKNIISFRNFTTGGKVYSETATVYDFRFLSNIVFQSPQDNNIEVGTGANDLPTSNIWVNGNIVMGAMRLATQGRSNTCQYFINNTVVNSGFTTSEHINSVYTNNTVFFPNVINDGHSVAYSSTSLSSNVLNIVWDWNKYYVGYVAWPWKWGFRTSEGQSKNSVGGGFLKFADDSGSAWRDWNGWDANSTYQLGWPTDYLTKFIQPNDYDSNRWHIAVVNTSAATSTTLDLSSIGFANGQSYQLVDAQNWPVVAASGVYTGGAITLPLTATNVSVINGTLTHYTNKHTNVDWPGLFNAFVLTRSGQRRHTHTIGSATLGSGSIQ